MARIRTIKPDFWSDEKIVELSFIERLAFIGLWNFADDAGRLEYSPKKLKMLIFPADDVNMEDVLTCLDMSGLILTYLDNENKYIQIKNFLKHQCGLKYQKSSKIPAPSEDMSRHILTEREREREREREKEKERNKEKETDKEKERASDDACRFSAKNDVNVPKPKINLDKIYIEDYKKYKHIIEDWFDFYNKSLKKTYSSSTGTSSNPSIKSNKKRIQNMIIVINDMLKENKTVQEIINAGYLAITGVFKSEYHIKNGYIDLELIFRPDKFQQNIMYNNKAKPKDDYDDIKNYARANNIDIDTDMSDPEFWKTWEKQNE